MRHVGGFAVIVLAVGLIGAGTALAAEPAFLKIAGISGESTQTGHQGEIDVLSFSWGVSQPHTIARTSRRAAVPLSSFTILKRVDKASPDLMSACSSGRHIPEVTVETRTMKYELHDVLISSCRAGGASGGGVTEIVVLNFATMQQIPVITSPSRVAPGSLAPNTALVRHP